MKNHNKPSGFKCRQCGACCRQAGFVYLKLQETGRMAGALHMDVYEFNERFCDLQDRQRLVLKKKSGESCVFLSGTVCSIYHARPQQCRDFPVLWRTERSESYCEGLLCLGSEPGL